MLKVLLTALIKQQYNLRILHWKAVGLDFHTTHVEILDDYIDKFSEYIDKVAEMIILVGEEIPTSNELDAIAANTNIGLKLKVKDYNSEEIFRILAKMFGDIISLIKECNDPDKYPSYICSELDSIEYWFSIEGLYKNRQTLK